MTLVEFRNDYIEGKPGEDAIFAVYIDGFPEKEEDDEKYACVLAQFILTKYGDFVVAWNRNDYRCHEKVLALIEESKKLLKELFMVYQLETEAERYESGKMLADDSEIEIDIVDGKVLICDYSPSRGSAEVVKEFCSADEIPEDIIEELCDHKGWSYVI